MMALYQKETRPPENKNNIFYLDVLRIFAIYLVLLLHALNPWLSVRGIYDSFTWKVALLISPLDRMGVPLFFMISGYLTLSDSRTLDFATFYKRRIPRILIPFLIWNLIYYIAYHIINGTAVSASEFLYAVFNQEIKYHFWYVYKILGMYAFAPFLKRIVDSCTKRQIVLFLMVILFPVTIVPFFSYFTHLSINSFPTMIEGYLGFFIFGYLLGKWPPERKWRLLMYGVGVVAWFGSSLGNYLSSSVEQIPLPFNYGYNLVHYLTSGAFFVLIQALSNRIEKILPAKTVKHWASITYGIYLCHVLCMEFWNGILRFDNPALNIASSFAGAVIVSTFVMFVISCMGPVKKLLM